MRPRLAMSFIVLMPLRRPRPSPFPYTTLFRSNAWPTIVVLDATGRVAWKKAGEIDRDELGKVVDRKSTRLNSSHLVISYAGFCLKKKITSARTGVVVCSR